MGGSELWGVGEWGVVTEVWVVGVTGVWGVVTAPIFSQIDELLMNDLHKFDTKTRRVFVFFLRKYYPMHHALALSFTKYIPGLVHISYVDHVLAFTKYILNPKS